MRKRLGYLAASAVVGSGFARSRNLHMKSNERVTTSDIRYTNTLTRELLATLSQSPFTEEQLASFSAEALAIVREQEAYFRRHPITAIFRFAAEGSQTRNGGVIQRATSPMKITLESGQVVHIALTGDVVDYPDGSQAEIISGAGQQGQSGERSIALVGSRLSNGDEIIDTLQGCALIAQRDGVPIADDFLADRA